MAHHHICDHCGIAFQSKKPDSRYCSHDCLWKAKLKPECAPRPCPYCGEVFKPKRTKRVFCSRACSSNAKIGQPAWNKSQVEQICRICGSMFSLSPSAIRRRSNHYCSRRCAGIANAQTNPANQPDRITKTCVQCGQDYEIIRSWGKTSKFCSVACHNVYKTTIRGDIHPLKKPLIDKTCEFCGESYSVKPSLAPRSRFCSKSCHGSWVVRNTASSTLIEQRIASLLDEMGLVYEAQKQMAKFLCDFALKQHRLIIECDGDYWHSFPERQAKDRRKDHWLESHGYRVLRLPEHKIKNDIEWCRQRISELTSQP